MIGVRQDDGGIVIGDLREKIERARAAGRRVKCIYTIPNFQNPSGVTLRDERRNQLIEIADEARLADIEDGRHTSIFTLRTMRRGLVPLAALRPDRVVNSGPFRKCLRRVANWPGCARPNSLRRKVELAKEGADLSSSVLDQAIVIESIRDGLIERRLPELRKFL
jgi:2-aminoadipate transaminase